jgi:hypothetical protein
MCAMRHPVEDQAIFALYAFAALFLFGAVYPGLRWLLGG